MATDTRSDYSSLTTAETLGYLVVAPAGYLGKVCGESDKRLIILHSFFRHSNSHQQPKTENNTSLITRKLKY